ncbi:protein Cep78 homolog [Musca domestica]|uniref:Protein Cep78 homolog n=1 Tax=Musca domestica TaxID=7370 RepID=A0A9J7DDV0_MUSDO|nr:protein Cep78 homolog [Musca domestica]XP_019890354.2 protein Cep78 homolog [Musca domestica]XP_019890355.2 protein Cep78 homolog [Musca domestica]
MPKCNNLELRDVSSCTSSKKLTRCRSFHFRYLELCRAKNLTPLTDIKAKNNCTSSLDFYGDKLDVNDWLLIVEALYYDQVLQTLAIRMRKTFAMVLEHLDTEKKARLFRQKPVLFTKFIFSGVVEAISNCIQYNKNLRVLILEGLPLNEKYVESIAKALSSNESLNDISFQRSNIGDKGCEAICNTIKYLENVEKLNLSECELTTKGAEYVADMVKIQKISRYTEGWQKSLRYRDVDPDTMPGLRSLTLARNPQIGDEGIKPIVEVLKEDVWIKVIDMENCGLTDRAANLILDCLELNNYIIDFNVRGNAGISKFLQRSIREQLGKEDEDQLLLAEKNHELVPGPNGTMIKRPKITIAALKEQIKTLEEQLEFERMLRKKAEQLNDKLNQQILAYESQLESKMNSQIPDGYVLVKDESLQSIIRERNDFQKLANSVAGSNDEATPRQSAHRLQQSTEIEQEEDETISIPFNGISSKTSEQTLTPKESRKSHKVRKVKSEMKYVESPPKDSAKRKISKSDHEFSNESDGNIPAIQIESNIGDTLSNNTSRSTVSTVINTRMQLRSAKKNNVNFYNNNNADCNINNNILVKNLNKNNNHNSNINLKKLELDDLSMTTPRSTNSEINSTSDSDTLRNDLVDNYQPLKVFIRRGKKSPAMPLTPIPMSPRSANDDMEPNETDNYLNNRRSKREKSPRSLFFGLGDE